MNNQDTQHRDSFVFYRSFYEAVKGLPDDLQLILIRGVVEYGLDCTIPDFSGVKGGQFVGAMFALIRPQLDANHKRFLNGCKGGAPTGSHNNPNGRRGLSNQKLTENKPNENENVNENENENGNVEVKPAVDDQVLNIPFQDPDFLSVWNKLREQPKWRNKTTTALQMSLDQLSKYKVQFAIYLMQCAIAGNHQGVVFSDTPSRYKRWLEVTPLAEQGQDTTSRPVRIVRDGNDIY